MRWKGIGRILVGLWVLWTTTLWAQAPERGVIESPSAFVSGIGFISGWKCNTNDITLKMYCRGILRDLDPAQNMLRSDTREVCDGRIDNGWIIQVNWEDWAGCTGVDALDNGRQFASREFTVGEVGDGFIRDQEGTQIRVPGFPSPDQVTHFAWSTATQHFEGMYTADCGTDDACPGSGDDGGNDGGDPAWDPYAAVRNGNISINDRFTAGTQLLPQYQGSLDFPLSNPLPSFSYSIIIEQGEWMFLKDSSKGTATLLIPHEEIESNAGAATLLAMKGSVPVKHNHSMVNVINLIGVGIEGLYLLVGSSSDPNYFGGGYGPEFYTRSNDPALFAHIPPDTTFPLPGYASRYPPFDPNSTRSWHYLNGETGEFGYRILPHLEGNKGEDRLTEQEILAVYFPNNNRGPLRYISTAFVEMGDAIRVGGRHVVYFPPTETVTYRENFKKGLLQGAGVNRRFARDDLRGTGKLEIIVMTAEMFDYWRTPPDPNDTYFGTTQVEYRSAATE